jgi:hypothetical protein
MAPLDCEELSVEAQQIFNQLKFYFSNPSSTDWQEEGIVKYEGEEFDLRLCVQRCLITQRIHLKMTSWIETRAIRFSTDNRGIIGFRNEQFGLTIEWWVGMLLLLRKLSREIESKNFLAI